MNRNKKVHSFVHWSSIKILVKVSQIYFLKKKEEKKLTVIIFFKCLLLEVLA